MHLFRTISQSRQFLFNHRQAKSVIGFIPTMGALHDGHISLVSRAVKECDLVVCSIFVNPIQFNNPNDLKKYPRTEKADLRLLHKAGCHMVFAPSVEEIYPQEISESFDFGMLDKVMEGYYRQGHFNGVAVVVKKLFEIIEPHRAYFGEKDFQQLAIIKAMTRLLNLPVLIIGCPTVREPSGLAMSSRNKRLNSKQQQVATNIYRIISRAAEMAAQFSPPELEKWVMAQFDSLPEIRLEYFSICDSVTLQPLSDWMPGRPAQGCIAAYVGEVRLIDNVAIVI